MQRRLPFVIAACALCAAAALFVGWRGNDNLQNEPAGLRQAEIKRPHLRPTPYPTPTPPPPSRQTEHMAFYKLDSDPAIKETPFGKLTKVSEWWKKGIRLREETPRITELPARAATPDLPPRSGRSIYQNQLQCLWTPETGQIERFINPKSPENPMGWNDYSLGQLTGDTSVGLHNSVLADGGTRREKGLTIHTVFVTRKGDGAKGPRWICQMDDKTNLPIQIDETNPRNGKWITTSRFVFVFNQRLPDLLFEPDTLRQSPPSPFLFPATQAP